MQLVCGQVEGEPFVVDEPDPLQVVQRRVDLVGLVTGT
jgi:hypothetical protein